tara:strand:- start:736 stop:1365 length:630 start_codon:yes stop_codon:yes gene_type:complete
MEFKRNFYNLFKEIIDRICALFFLIILSPFALIIAFLISINLGKPIIFCHLRAGLNGEPFRLFKFRSMTNELDLNGELMPPDQRLTDFGLFLRSTSLDEIPSLLNVLKGDISFVGPRPLLLEYLPLYSSEQSLRHCVKPGITGLAQVNGRNAIPWNERFIFDINYVKNKSFFLDLKILLITVFKVFSRKGITPNNKPIMDAFTGEKGLN